MDWADNWETRGETFLKQTLWCGVLYIRDFTVTFSSASDLAMVNMYINKLLENVGSLVYTENEAPEQGLFTIKAIRSSLKEKMPLVQVFNSNSNSIQIKKNIH